MPKKSSLRNLKAESANDIITRMCIVAKVQNRNQLSKILDVAPNVIAGWITRNNVPYKWIHYIADKFDSSFDFIKRGYTLDADEIAKEAELDTSEEPRKYSYIKKPIKHIYIAMPRAYDTEDTENTLDADSSDIDETNLDVYHIRKITSVKASAGGGNELEGIKVYKTGEVMPISKAFFKAPPGKEICSMEIEGESMLPVLKPGDWVIFSEDGIFKGDGLYVVNFSNQLMVKILQITPQGTLKIISANKEFQSYEINLDETQETCRLVGKVLKSIV